MIVLALDSTTRDGSVAVWQDGHLRRVEPGDAALTYSSRLPGHLLAVLEAVELRIGDVDVFAVASGPGSLTGLRVGLATIQGLAFASGRGVVAVPALELVARGAVATLVASGCDEIGVCRDAARGEVFWGRWTLDRTTGSGPGDVTLVEVDEPRVLTPDALLDMWRERDAVPRAIAGDGWPLCRARAEECGFTPPVVAVPLLAGPLAERAGALAARGMAAPPHAVHPVYVRRPDAELARDRHRAAAAVPLRP